MNYNELFYLVYISQIVLISVVIPFWAVKRVNHMLDNYPPENYAKLYPVSTTTIKYAINTFKLLSAMVVLIGGVIIGITVANSADELMNWDSQSMLTITFFLQLLPFLYLGLSGVKYQQLMRKVSQSTQRKANLKPRKVSDYVSKHLLVAAMVSFLAYTLMVVYIQQNPFPGFVGYWNILFVLLLNAFYFFMVHRIISGRKSDPHQAQEDRMIHLSLVAKLLIMY